MLSGCRLTPVRCCGSWLRLPFPTDLGSCLVSSLALWHFFTFCALRRQIFFFIIDQSKSYVFKDIEEEIFLMILYSITVLKCMLFISHFLHGHRWSRGLNYIQKKDPSLFPHPVPAQAVAGPRGPGRCVQLKSLHLFLDSILRGVMWPLVFFEWWQHL